MKLKLLTIGFASATLLSSSVYAGSITAVSWGGAYTTSQVEAYHKPWASNTGNSVVSEDYGGGLAEIRSQVEAGNVTWDVVDVEYSDAILGCDEGLFEEIDSSMLPSGSDGSAAMDDFIPNSVTECAVGNILWSTIYAYDFEKMPNGPKTMADFFDLDKFPGKRGMRRGPKPNLEFALIADGVAASDVYDVLSTEAGVDRAFAKLDTIKDSVV